MENKENKEKQRDADVFRAVRDAAVRYESVSLVPTEGDKVTCEALHQSLDADLMKAMDEVIESWSTEDTVTVRLEKAIAMNGLVKAKTSDSHFMIDQSALDLTEIPSGVHLNSFKLIYIRVLAKSSLLDKVGRPENSAVYIEDANNVLACFLQTGIMDESWLKERSGRQCRLTMACAAMGEEEANRAAGVLRRAVPPTGFNTDIFSLTRDRIVNAMLEKAVDRSVSSQLSGTANKFQVDYGLVFVYAMKKAGLDSKETLAMAYQIATLTKYRAFTREMFKTFVDNHPRLGILLQEDIVKTVAHESLRICPFVPTHNRLAMGAATFCLGGNLTSLLACNLTAQDRLRVLHDILAAQGGVSSIEMDADSTSTVEHAFHQLCLTATPGAILFNRTFMDKPGVSSVQFNGAVLAAMREEAGGLIPPSDQPQPSDQPHSSKDPISSQAAGLRTDLHHPPTTAKAPATRLTVEDVVNSASQTLRQQRDFISEFVGRPVNDNEMTFWLSLDRSLSDQQKKVMTASRFKWPGWQI